MKRKAQYLPPLFCQSSLLSRLAVIGTKILRDCQGRELYFILVYIDADCRSQISISENNSTDSKVSKNLSMVRIFCDFNCNHGGPTDNYPMVGMISTQHKLRFFSPPPNQIAICSRLLRAIIVGTHKSPISIQVQYLRSSGSGGGDTQLTK